MKTLNAEYCLLQLVRKGKRAHAETLVISCLCKQRCQCLKCFLLILVACPFYDL